MKLLRNLFGTMLAFGLFVGMPLFASAATLWVYVDVEDRYSDEDYDARDFTVEVEGEDVSDESFRGDEDGTKVTLDEGDYEVTIRNDRGFYVRYSSGCEGDIDDNDTERCRITLEDRDNYYRPYPNPVYTGGITLQKGYIPSLPATGFPPVSLFSVAFAFSTLAVAGFFLYPYVRKAFAAVLR